MPTTPVPQKTIVIAPDSFKGSLDAVGVAQAIAAGWRSLRPGDNIRLVPLADGGEGTVDAIEAAVAGSRRRDAGEVTGPDGRPVRGEWLELPDGTAVVELAQMSGLPLMAQLDPLGATTYGLGEVIRAALEAGARRLVVGLGGSASTDAAAGALAALGLGTAPADHAEHLRRGGGGLIAIPALDRSGLLPPPAGGVVLLTDVDAPLLGPRGAAAVFGPQKGATPGDVERLDAALAHFARLLGGDDALPGAGAAGGAGYGFAAAWGATIEPGADYIARLSGVHEQVAEADVVLTGEGRFDATSVGGKLVGQVIRIAGPGDARIGVIAGSLGAQPTWDDEPLWAIDLVGLAGSTGAAMGEPGRWLREAGMAAARALG